MQNNEMAYPSFSAGNGWLLLNAVKNILYILAAFLSFSLWFASTVNTPKKIEELETRLQHISSVQNKLENKLDLLAEEIRFIKNNIKNNGEK